MRQPWQCYLTSELTSFTNLAMHLFHIPQCTIQNRKEICRCLFCMTHVGYRTGASWDLWNLSVVGRCVRSYYCNFLWIYPIKYAHEFMLIILVVILSLISIVKIALCNHNKHQQITSTNKKSSICQLWNRRNRLLITPLNVFLISWLQVNTRNSRAE